MSTASAIDTGPAIGTGVYSYAEAACLLGVSRQQIVGWVEGYSHQVLTGRAHGVLQRGKFVPGVLTFRDLVELIWVKSFRKAGVPLSAIREAAERLALMYATSYPFSLRMLATDGSRLIDEVGGDLFIAGTGQQVFGFVAPWLKNLVFDESGVASHWFPLGEASGVVVNPRRSFGAPITVDGGVRTDVLYDKYVVEEGDAETVAEWYQVATTTVEQAVRFEEWLREEAPKRSS
jgi:uncharacterized protein (DUF433 family)